MTGVYEVIRECQQQGIRLSPNGDKLHVVPASSLTPELKELLIRHKPDILAALANEDAQEYVAERTAICAADGQLPCAVRPVFEYRLSGCPAQPLIMLGLVGESLADAEASLHDRFGDALVDVRPYVWPPQPRLKLH